MFNKSNSNVKIYEEHTIKTQPKVGADREFCFLLAMRDTGFVPLAIRKDKETIIMKTVKATPITDEAEFVKNCHKFYNEKYSRGIRHGNLTTAHVIPVNNSPVVIDWSDARWFDDPVPDKRADGDWRWLCKTIANILNDTGYIYYEPVNTRFESMFGFILSALAPMFAKKKKLTFFDFGYGFGDIIFTLNDFGHFVTGVEHDPVLYKRMRDLGVTTYQDDIENFIISHGDFAEKFDVMICTSVLPYLNNPNRVVEFIARNSERSIFEIQSLGDGPGELKSQYDVFKYLRRYFKTVIQIGSTMVKENRFERELFLCDNLK